MAVFTRISCIVSGGGVAMPWPIWLYTEGVVWLVVLFAAPKAPVLAVNRLEATWLVLLPLNRLFVVKPFNEKLLLVSRWPLAQIDWLPRPAFVLDVFRKSALTPGAWIANWVKLPVPSG